MVLVIVSFASFWLNYYWYYFGSMNVLLYQTDGLLCVLTWYECNVYLIVDAIIKLYIYLLYLWRHISYPVSKVELVVLFINSLFIYLLLNITVFIVWDRFISPLVRSTGSNLNGEVRVSVTRTKIFPHCPLSNSIFYIFILYVGVSDVYLVEWLSTVS